MTTKEMKFFVVDLLPTGEVGNEFVPQALYFYKAPGAEEAQIFKANDAGTDLIPFSEKLTGQNALMYTGVSAPEATGLSYRRFWYNTAEGNLYVNQTNYNPTTSDTWESEAVWQPATTIPEGLQLVESGSSNGTATTAARSDHYHTGLMIKGADF